MTRAMNISDVNPDWAWSPYKPSAESPWDIRCAAHLFRRAGFAANRSELYSAVQLSPGEVVGDLMVASREGEVFETQMQALIRAALASGNAKQLSAQWVYRMLRTPRPLLEKTTLFWHGHFATSAQKVEVAELMQTQNDLLRKHALGDFNTLLLGIARDPAMLIYLDSVSNRKSHPNENFAREIMELFCLGEGNYSEEDVRELARCCTGWEIKRKKFRFNQYQHDGGTKTLLGETGNFGGEQGVALVAKQASAPRFIVAKLVKFFVMDEPTVSERLVDPLAKKLRKDDMNVGPTIQRILSSNLFFSSHARARKIRSPAEFAIGFLRSMNGSADAYKLADSLHELGQGLYFPPSVKGWDGGRTWINSSTLLGRSNLIRQILDHSKTRFAKKSLADYLRQQEIKDVSSLIDWIEPLLFAVPIPQAAKSRVAKLVGSDDDRMKDAIHILCSLPEFQLA
ncbi:DUF1800 domain-containing protein [Planctomycetes bacterium K23_9]|uniref:DUF1800 domain-containing protein n=1 Tax=Stieleria marina TaxID=1930275 RepID=A0A517P3F8_9BACT|nr:hypothetical protein K239x_59290 [Planctomycetes bacterium K23_9]